MRLLSNDGMWAEQEDFYNDFLSPSEEGYIQQGNTGEFIIKIVFVMLVLILIKFMFIGDMPDIFDTAMVLVLFAALGWCLFSFISFCNDRLSSSSFGTLTKVFVLALATIIILALVI